MEKHEAVELPLSGAYHFGRLKMPHELDIPSSPPTLEILQESSSVIKDHENNTSHGMMFALNEVGDKEQDKNEQILECKENAVVQRKGDISVQSHGESTRNDDCSSNDSSSTGYNSDMAHEKKNIITPFSERWNKPLGQPPAMAILPEHAETSSQLSVVAATTAVTESVEKYCQSSETHDNMPSQDQVQEQHPFGQKSVQEKCALSHSGEGEELLHDNDDISSTAIAATSLCAISTGMPVNHRLNAVTPVARGIKRKQSDLHSTVSERDEDGGDDDGDQNDPLQGSPPTAFQTPVAPRMASGSPHGVPPVTATDSATAQPVNTLNRANRARINSSSWIGPASTTSWYTPQSGTIPHHGISSGPLHPGIYYPGYNVGRDEGVVGAGGNNFSHGNPAGVNHQYLNRYMSVSGPPTDYIVPNSSYYTPHRMASHVYPLRHPQMSNAVSNGKSSSMEHTFKDDSEADERDVKKLDKDTKDSNGSREAFEFHVSNRIESQFTPYPQTPMDDARMAFGTRGIPPQQYYGYYYPPPPPHLSSTPSTRSNQRISFEYQPSYHLHMPPSVMPSSDKKEENEIDDEHEKGLCLYNCERVFISKSGYVPDKVFPKDDEVDSYDVKLPPFQQLVNYPHNTHRKRWGEEMRCVMCGEKHYTSHSKRLAAVSQPGLPSGSPDGEDLYIIPKQNKGLCTACDNTVWKIRKTGKEIKWCKGCKNFKAWEAFGEKYLATKCVKCREKQKEKYARKTGKLVDTGDSAVKSNRPINKSTPPRNDGKELFIVTGQRNGGTANQGLSFLIAASNQVSEQD